MSQRYIGGLIYNPPGGFSGYFDGSGDYLTAGTTSSFNFLHNTTALFTIEAWIYCSSFSAAPVLFSTNSGTSAEIGTTVFINSSAQLRLLIGKGSAGNPVIDTSSSGTVPTNQWVHIAVTYDQSLGSNNAVFWVNGVSAGTASKTGNAPSSSNSTYPGTINGYGTTGGAACYLSNVRVNNSIVYSAAFTPPVGPLQAITNTSLLTCAYPTFRDGSTNNFTITVNGNTAVSTQNPFPQTQLPNPALGNQGNGVYSMSQYQALRSQNLWPAIDPYFDYVTLMLHGNGTNGAQNNTFLDSSTNNFTITRNGNTTQGTFTPYGANWSNYFDGNGDYLNLAYNSAFDFGTGDMTIELFFMLTADAAANNDGTRDAALICAFPNSGVFNDTWSIGIGGSASTTGTLISFDRRINNAPTSIAYTATITKNVWHHVAVVRSGSTCSLYYDGARVAVNSAFSGIINAGGYPIKIGALNYAGYLNMFPGYISNVRVLKGTALYSGSTYTVPAAPFTVITNTSLLTCADNRFIDDSTNNFTITRNGDVSVQRFSPFAPTTPYAAGTIGGSGYYDGSGDSLSAGDQTAFEFGAGAFTIEAWVYPTSYSSVFTIAQKYVGGDVANSEFLFYATTAGRLAIALDGGGGEDFFQSATGLVPLNTWTHCAVTKSGSTVLLFVNGVQVQSGTSSRTLNSTSTALFAGVSGTAGYMTDLRLLKGTALYTGAFTPPSAPLTNIANTSLLLNFTNGGIIDNAMMNDLETVGNAQISTSVSKFGGGSLAFDGSGDYLFAPSRATTSLEGDFTIELWAFRAATGLFRAWCIGDSITSSGVELYVSGGGNWTIWGNNAERINAGTATRGVWTHLAFVRSGSTITMYVNGVASGSTWSYSTAFGGGVLVGAELYNGTIVADTNGYIDDLRITKGYARYTANFTPQRSQWQDQ